MPTALEQAKRLTIDPGVHYLADLIDQLTARVDECCGSASLTVAPAKGAADSAASTATGAESPAPPATGAKAAQTKGGAGSSAPARKKQGHQ